MDSAQQNARPENPKATDVAKNTPTVGSSTSKDAQKPFEDAYLNYMGALQDAWSPEAAQQRFMEAYLNYMRALQEARAPEDDLKRYEAYLNYMRALQEAWVPLDMRKRLEEAYLHYVRALKGAWGQANAEDVDAGTLTAIGQSMSAIGSWAWNTMPRR